METREGSSPPTAVLIVGENAAAADLALMVLSVLGPRGVLLPDAAAATAYLNEFAEDTAAVLVDGELDGDLTGEEFTRFVTLAWPRLRVGLIWSGESRARPSAPERVAWLSSPILPLQLITFLQDSVDETAASL